MKNFTEISCYFKNKKNNNIKTLSPIKCFEFNIKIRYQKKLGLWKNANKIWQKKLYIKVLSEKKIKMNWEGKLKKLKG